jgi:AraC-like DNA-binding protein
VTAQLLEETDLRLTEIAARIGYRSEFSFSRAFKLARGVSPIQCRRADSFKNGKGRYRSHTTSNQRADSFERSGWIW